MFPRGQTSALSGRDLSAHFLHSDREDLDSLSPFLESDPCCIPDRMVGSSQHVSTATLEAPVVWKILRRFRLQKIRFLSTQKFIKFSLIQKVQFQILGKALPELLSDYQFQSRLHTHIAVGEQHAQAALQAELIVCEVAGVDPKLYVGRSQYPQLKNKNSVYKNGLEE